MKSILVIGMGRFGRHLSLKFAALGNEVMIVDTDENKLKDLLSSVTSAQIGDCTDEDVLKSLGVKNFDVCFVCIGTNFQASLEVTSLLKELGAKKVISKANRDIHAKFLLRNGADEVIYPERNMAEKVAAKYSVNNVFDYIELTDEYSICEIPPVESWEGRTIGEVNCRAKYHISILATKEGDNIYPMPGADHVFKPNEHLMVLAKINDIQKVLKHM